MTSHRVSRDRSSVPSFPTGEATLNRRAFTGATAVAAAGLLLGGRFGQPADTRAAQAGTSVSLALDWYPTSQHAGIFVAQAKGYFTAAGLDVKVYTPADPTTVLQTVGAGRDTFGISYQTDLLFARGEQVPIVSVAALVQHPLNSLMFKESANITRPADLKGKSVGIAGLPSDDAFLSTMLKTDGLSLDDISVVNVGYDLLPALLAGRVDAVMGAYWTHESIVAEQQGTPVGYLRVEQWGVPDYYELVVVTGEDYANQYPETVSALLGAIQHGYDDAMADPDGAIAILKAASEDVDVAVERKGIDLLIPLWTDNGAVPFGTQTSARWQAYGDWLKEQGLLKGDVDLAAALRSDLLPAGAATPAASPQASPAS
ncbi:MAG: ABC transporter substrate-binding protein [Thermomicrobiales bacterium]